ncbi:hypothetical protein HPP92_024471 [Vanilla planifolia]|uniref:U-box domain-containing protein n=1 Tax=Vanilla planifolia TaxID=51239 RepID=A0A835UCZ3_VANPL|nr:hypothetical protein HPP92_024471 [Vanilla planifolia]
MKDPVILPTGITYDRRSIETWLEAGNPICPVTKQVLLHGVEADLIPNHSIRRMIQDWCVAHRSLGVDRIPTPKIPITSLQVKETLSDISTACRRGDRSQCAEHVAKLASWSAESERNRRTISSNGAARALASTFRDIPSEQLLSALARILPLSRDAQKELSSPSSLNSIVSIMRNGSLSGRLHAVVLVNELAAADAVEDTTIAGTEGMVEALTMLVKDPISPRATKASLVTAYRLSSADDKAASRFAELGIVPALIEMLVDTDQSMCEKGLAVLDVVLSSEAGREAAAGHALTVPVLAKKMFRVSDLATEFAVSALWKLCRNQEKGKKASEEALQVGIFQKLLLLLQVGCGEKTKKKAGKMLRRLNGLKGKVECIDSVDFRGLKRPF